ncbi:hypothetical protein Taro_020850 [Colocasia esculenta]|uniref:Uncharacterized protein n=1 Tax=Colocasia esculenta TaxID=4460 RepID=A0A843UZW1_COLES|nr:hypothetical protein [Colocasia esculenta]
MEDEVSNTQNSSGKASAGNPPYVGGLQGVGEHADDLVLVRHVLHLPRPAASVRSPGGKRKKEKKISSTAIDRRREKGEEGKERDTISPPMVGSSPPVAPSPPASLRFSATTAPRAPVLFFPLLEMCSRGGLSVHGAPARDPRGARHGPVAVCLQV